MKALRFYLSAATALAIAVLGGGAQAQIFPGGGGGGGAVSSVTGSGNTTCSPTTGSVVCTTTGAQLGVVQTFTAAQTFGEIHGTTYTPTLTTNNYTATSADCGKVLLFPTGTAPTLTLPNLNSSCVINVIQNSAVQFTPQAASGGTLLANVNGYTKSKGQNAFLTFVITVPSATAATWSWSGDGA